MERYFTLAREPKTIQWYPAAHALADPQAPRDGFAFLSRYPDDQPLNADARARRIAVEAVSGRACRASLRVP